MKPYLIILLFLIFTVSPVLASTKDACIQMTDTLENSQTDPAWNYAENINDGRGITFGCIGFCTGTYDGNVLIKYYTSLNPNNPLAKYIPALDKIDAGSHNAAGGDGNPSIVGLSGFVQDVQNNKDPVFKQAQLYELDQLYWNPAYAEWQKIGAKYPLTLALLYDASVREGPDGMLKLVRRAGSTSSEAQFDSNFILAYKKVLQAEGLGDTTRMIGFTNLLLAGNYNLTTPLTFVAYGDSFTITGNLGISQVVTPVNTSANNTTVNTPKQKHHFIIRRHCKKR